MFSLAIHYLNGWAMAAADGAKKQQAEWPPHPDRVFMALAAACFETGEDPTEGDALRWLEALPTPMIAASPCSTRALTTSYVPVNDARRGAKLPTSQKLDKLKDAGLSILPEFRSRQPRAFPVAIPWEPVTHLIWQDANPAEHRQALENLFAKLTHVGHSASLVQGWLDDEPPEPTLAPSDAVGGGVRKLRVPSENRLHYLKQRLNRDGLIAHDELAWHIKRLDKLSKSLKTIWPPRRNWDNMPDALLLADESSVKQHGDYTDAKQGNADSANRLIADCITPASHEAIQRFLARFSEVEGLTLVSAHAWEGQGVNAIPSALATTLADDYGLAYERELIQTNYVGHTGADGFTRMAWQAAFDGPVVKGMNYIMVDDFIGQGGTLANLRGYLIKKGAKVLGAIALTGKPYSAKLNPTNEQLDELRRIHGEELDKWWKDHFGHPFRHLTQSEARYLARTEDADRVRTKIAEAKQAGNHSSGFLGKEEIRSQLTTLKKQLADQFPNGRPISLRPEPGRWASYRPIVEQPCNDTPRGHFDPNFIIFTLSGKRLSLPATLKLTSALRGLLLKQCAIEPVPEWFSGHQADGRPTRKPHLALFPLPFVDAEHADGSIMGLAIALPAGLSPAEAGKALEPVLIDPDTGLARAHKLFDGRWLECGLEMELRERPPLNLRHQSWNRPSRIWASVTPLVLDRHFKGPQRWTEAENTVRISCERIGLPTPLEVQLNPVSALRGVPHAREFPAIRRKSDAGTRQHIHAVLVFEQPVAGPVLLGAGRFRGYGLFRPLNDSTESLNVVSHKRDASNG